ncbi:hypothetical protein ACHAPU_002039 [Fusarium lateritium]
METVTNFEFFPDLPIEIRNGIWKIALSLDSPRAYFVDVALPSLDLEETEDPTARANQRQPQRAAINRAPPSIFPPTLSTSPWRLNNSTALKRACYESRRETAQNWKNLSPNGAVDMHIDVAEITFPNFPPFELRGETYGPLGEASVVLDGRNDLLVIEEIRLGSYVMDHEFGLDAVADRNARYKGLENVHQVAIPFFDNEEEDPDLSLYVQRIRIVFPNLRKLYVWTAPENLSQDDPVPRWHLAKQENEEEASIKFNMSDRVFYELDPTKLEENNILDEPMRVFHLEDKAVELGFLSWVWA